MNQYILVHTSIYSDFLHTNAFISSYSIHHGTGQYNEVPESPVPLDYDLRVKGGASRYKALYCLLPCCTVVIQVYRTFGYFIVLPCTVMYRVTGYQGINV